ncbi:hypothetical protein [Paenibacillus naphthalenovorans]|uniref:hypothetical protein n=1 Tax=Paenibacillus naphthalenovorans TaxID=162209 RepID=UPI003D2C3303
MEKSNKPFYEKWWVWVIVAVVLGSAVSWGDDEDQKTISTPVSSAKTTSASVSTESEKEAEEAKIKAMLDFKGELELIPEPGKLTLKIKTNAMDGSLLEALIMNGELKSLSDFVIVKDGLASKEFAVPKDWNSGYVAAMAMFRFNLEENPQPDAIKKIYGNDGERLTGDLVKSNDKGGKYAIVEAADVAYPDEATVKKDAQAKFDSAVAEMVKASGGFVKGITKRYEDWAMVNVVVSDGWYGAQDFEKERFAEQIGRAIGNAVKGAGLHKDAAAVYFVDTYGKTVASPKVFGGYDIKR